MEAQTNEVTNQEKHEKLSNWFWSILLVVSIVFFVISASIYFVKSYFNTFWVNGQSMYPTLNGSAVNKNGESYGLVASDGDYIDGKKIDFGLFNSHDSIFKKLKRFDIVLTNYNSNPEDSLKIKRIVGMPGETIYFISTGSGKEHNGDLYVNGEYVAQPISDEMIRSGFYANYSSPITLKADEYFVCGDNRGHSYDSTDIGPIKKDWIEGKFVALIGYCQVKYEDGEYKPYKVRYHWPRRLK